VRFVRLFARWLGGFIHEIHDAAGTGDCSFCGLPCDLGDIVQARGINICAGCVDICIAILEDRVTAAGAEDSPAED
jgi:hypothetical protein